ncbi:MAG: hypothetical protein QOF34_875 [Sphingomonadales bacterium]|nr:hypothetical protein [Sphingomonadales bacterium]
MLRFLAGACLIVTPLAAAAAQPADLASSIVNDPGAPQVNGAKASLHDDPKVQGGKAIRIQIAAKGKNVWDSSIGSPVTKPVKAGDQLVLAFWVRLEKGENGAATATLPYNAVQLASAPWSPLFNQSAEVGPEWKLVQIKGAADKDYAAGALTATMHLATARQTLDFGPIVILDLGKGQ